MFNITFIGSMNLLMLQSHLWICPVFFVFFHQKDIQRIEYSEQNVEILSNQWCRINRKQGNHIKYYPTIKHKICDKIVMVTQNCCSYTDSFSSTIIHTNLINILIKYSKGSDVIYIIPIAISREKFPFLFYIFLMVVNKSEEHLNIYKCFVGV